jgi:hypothetical protein
MAVAELMQLEQNHMQLEQNQARTIYCLRAYPKSVVTYFTTFAIGSIRIRNSWTSQTFVTLQTEL